MGWEQGQHVNEGSGINLEPKALLARAAELRNEAAKINDSVHRSAIEGNAEWYEKQASYPPDL
ncbi:MAG: hypothetical protein Q7R74_01935 [bacterium]|nr:hypothetical protein [bacterium]